jgi:hypothetical protein
MFYCTIPLKAHNLTCYSRIFALCWVGESRSSGWLRTTKLRFSASPSRVRQAAIKLANRIALVVRVSLVRSLDALLRINSLLIVSLARYFSIYTGEEPKITSDNQTSEGAYKRSVIPVPQVTTRGQSSKLHVENKVQKCTNEKKKRARTTRHR